VKTSVAVTNARQPGGQFVLGARTLPGAPYDGRSLAAQIDQVARLTGRPVQRAYVGEPVSATGPNEPANGYRGHSLAREGLQVVLSHTRGILSPTIRREMRRRNAIEPVLGHRKTDGLLERNHLHGPDGDAVYAILCAVGHNCRLLLAWFRRLLACLANTAPSIVAEILDAIAAIIQPRPTPHILAV
jgi:IS5 family transposase